MRKLADKKICLIGYAVMVFLFLVLFYTVINPVTVLDTDDWYYITEFRRPFPEFRGYNPIKAFPEFFEPVVSYAGAYFLYPILKNYYLTLTVSNALFISLILSVYFYEFTVFISQKFNTTFRRTILTGSIFFVLHIAIFLHVFGNSETLLYARDMNCIYNYTLCTALNAALSMHIMSYGGVKEIVRKSSLIHKLILLLWVYFSFFSNLYSSIVLASYVASDLLVVFIPQIKSKRFVLSSLFKDNLVQILILIWWLITHVYEFSGVRAGNSSDNILLSFLLAVAMTMVWVIRISIFVLAFSVLTVVLWRKHCRPKSNINVEQYVICLSLTLAYIVLLSTVVYGLYAGRTEVFFPVMFWILIGVMCFFTELTNADSIFFRIAYILLGGAVIILMTWGHAFKYANIPDLSYVQSEALMNNVIDQFVAAEEQGKTEIDLVVPKFDRDDNWPLAIYGKDRFGKALYRHGVIHYEIQVNELILSEEMTEKYLPKVEENKIVEWLLQLR